MFNLIDGYFGLVIFRLAFFFEFFLPVFLYGNHKMNFVRDDFRFGTAGHFDVAGVVVFLCGDCQDAT